MTALVVRDSAGRILLPQPADMPAALREALDKVKHNELGEAVLNDSLIEALSSLIQSGSTVVNAVKVVGLRQSTLRKWLAVGESNLQAGRTTIETRLGWALDQALGVYEHRLASASTRIAEADGELALKILERRNPTDWAPAAPAQPLAGSGDESPAALREHARHILAQEVAEPKTDEH